MSMKEISFSVHLCISLYLTCKNISFVHQYHRQVKSVECLLALGALPNAKNQDSQTPLHIAV